MGQLTVEAVVELANEAWAERIIGTDFHDEVMEFVSGLTQVYDRHDTDYAMILAMNAAVSASMLAALRNMAAEDEFDPSNLEIFPEVSVELIRRALINKFAN